MHIKHKSIALLLLIIAMFLIWQNSQKKFRNGTTETPANYQNATGRDAKDDKKNKEYPYMPHHFFDEEVPLPQFKKIEGNGVTVAKHFNHDIQSPNENFGHYMRDKIYEDHNKVEILLNEADEFLLYRVNYKTYQTHRNELEARKNLLKKGVGSIKYGNAFTKKYPEACYFQVIQEANESTNNWPVYYGDSAIKEIEIYPFTFTYDEFWSEGGGEYLKHEGFLVISSEGLDYELENDEIRKIPVHGKIRRDYQLIGLRVNEAAKNERERFDKQTAITGVRIWEDIKVPDK